MEDEIFKLKLPIGIIIRRHVKQGRDCCSTCDIDYIHPIKNTVNSFIRTVLTVFPDEWGYISINPYSQYTKTGYIEYENGKIVEDKMTIEQKSAIIEHITSNGGYDFFTYNISI